MLSLSVVLLQANDCCRQMRQVASLSTNTLIFPAKMASDYYTALHGSWQNCVLPIKILLCFSCRKLTDSCGEHLAFLSQLSSLSFAGSAWISGTVVDSLAELSGLKRLELQDSGYMVAKSLEGISKLCELEYLNLDSVEVTHQQMGLES